MTIEGEMKPVVVLETAKQTGESRSYDWVERSIWTERMLETLARGVWPNKFFQEHGLFSLVDAHRAILQSSLR